MPATSREPGSNQPGDTFMFGSTRAMAVVQVNDDGSFPTGTGIAGAAGYPAGAVPVTASSGSVAAAAAVATLPNVAGKTTYITGFEITSGGSTAAALVAATLAGIKGGTATYIYGTVAGATAQNAPLTVQFPSPVPASAVNTAIVLTLPSLGAGNTNASVVAHGFQL